MNIKIPIHQRCLEARKKAINKWKVNYEDKKNLIKFLNDSAIGKVNKGKRISENRQIKYLDLLKIPLEFFNKSTAKLEIKDVERLEKALISNSLKSKLKKKPYSAETKADIKRILKIYIKWLSGEDRMNKLCGWLDLRTPKKTPNFLTEKEIIKLFKACKDNEERFLIAVLFDSGARAEEFHNIRYEDIQLPSEKQSFVKITLKEEYSKTKGRTISLYWNYTLEAVRDYLRDREKEGIKNDEAVFKKTYDNTRQIITRLGLRVINKRLHYHLFRHTSATYYANKMNRQELCYRYGWKFSSDMPDTYISRAGMENKDLDDKFSSTELEELRKKIEEYESKNKLAREGLEGIENMLRMMHEVFKANPEMKIKELKLPNYKSTVIK